MMKHQPERTCVGCRGIFKKGDVVRVVAGPAAGATAPARQGVVIDYREKLPGRAAYVCPRKACIKAAIEKGQFSRALRLQVVVPSVSDFTLLLAARIEERITSLLAMSAKAGKLAAGYSAVQDALDKGRVALVLFARDISEGTKEKVSILDASIPRVSLFSRDQLGKLLNRELVGVVAIEDKGFAEAITKEEQRLKGLINQGD